MTGNSSHDNFVEHCHAIFHGVTRRHTVTRPVTPTYSRAHSCSLPVSHAILHSPSQSVPHTHCHACKLLGSLAQSTSHTAVPTLTPQSGVAHTLTGTRSHSSSHLRVSRTVTYTLTCCHNTMTVSHYPTRSVSHTVTQFLTVCWCG